MSTVQINIKEARHRFSELVNSVAYKRQRIVIASRNKPKAVLISVEDARGVWDCCHPPVDGMYPTIVA